MLKTGLASDRARDSQSRWLDTDENLHSVLNVNQLG